MKLIARNINSNNGFSILEIIIAIFIIVLGLISVLSLIMQNIQVQYINKNMLIASQLAQEGVELVRNVRDNNWQKGYDWLYGNGSDSDTDIVQDGEYAIDYEGNIYNIDDISDAGLYINDDNFYTHDDNSGTASSTIFYRLITASDITASTIILSCQVQWRERGGNHQYTIDTTLNNWR